MTNILSFKDSQPLPDSATQIEPHLLLIAGYVHEFPEFPMVRDWLRDHANLLNISNNPPNAANLIDAFQWYSLAAVAGSPTGAYNAAAVCIKLADANHPDPAEGLSWRGLSKEYLETLLHSWNGELDANNAERATILLKELNSAEPDQPLQENPKIQKLMDDRTPNFNTGNHSVPEIKSVVALPSRTGSLQSPLQPLLDGKDYASVREYLESLFKPVEALALTSSRRVAASHSAIQSVTTGSSSQRMPGYAEVIDQWFRQAGQPERGTFIDEVVKTENIRVVEKVLDIIVKIDGTENETDRLRMRLSQLNTPDMMRTATPPVASPAQPPAETIPVSRAEFIKSELERLYREEKPGEFRKLHETATAEGFDVSPEYPAKMAKSLKDYNRAFSLGREWLGREIKHGSKSKASDALEFILENANEAYDANGAAVKPQLLKTEKIYSNYIKDHGTADLGRFCKLEACDLLLNLTRISPNNNSQHLPPRRLRHVNRLIEEVARECAQYTTDTSGDHLSFTETACVTTAVNKDALHLLRMSDKAFGHRSTATQISQIQTRMQEVKYNGTLKESKQRHDVLATIIKRSERANFTPV